MKYNSELSGHKLQSAYFIMEKSDPSEPFAPQSELLSPLQTSRSSFFPNAFRTEYVTILNNL